MSELAWLRNVPIDLCKSAGEQHKIDWHLIAAIVMTESAGNCWKPRHEPGYRWLYFPRELAEKVGVTYDTMVIMQKTSWGLMQVMGAVAYELGLSQDMVPTQLCLPHVGIDFGCRLLVRLFHRYNTEAQVISAYNAGSVRMVNGMFGNQRYVDKVHSYLNELRKLS